MTAPQLVRITWSDPADDWPWFWLIKAEPTRVLLVGADFPDGSAEHNGGSFWAQRSEIKRMTRRRAS